MYQENLVNFSVIKQKIIKTDEILRMYLEMSSKWKQAQQVCKEIKLQYDQILNNFNRIQLEHERCTYNFENLKQRINTLDKENRDLQEQKLFLEEQFNQQSVQSQLTIKQLQDELKILSEAKHAVINVCPKRKRGRKPKDEVNYLKDTSRSSSQIQNLEECTPEGVVDEYLGRITPDNQQNDSIDPFKSNVFSETESIGIQTYKVAVNSSHVQTIETLESLDFKDKVISENKQLKQEIFEHRSEIFKLKIRQNNLLRNISTQTDETDVEDEYIEGVFKKVFIPNLLPPMSPVETENLNTTLSVIGIDSSIMSDIPNDEVTSPIPLLTKNFDITDVVQEGWNGNTNPATSTSNSVNNFIRMEIGSENQISKKHKYRPLTLNNSFVKLKKSYLNKLLRKRYILEKKVLKLKKMQKQDNLLKALCALKHSKINFAISNETSSSKFYDNEYKLHCNYTQDAKLTPITNYGKYFTEQLNCMCKSCNQSSMLLNNINGQVHLLGFYNIKEEFNTPSSSRIEKITDVKSESMKLNHILKDNCNVTSEVILETLAEIISQRLDGKKNLLKRKGAALDHTFKRKRVLSYQSDTSGSEIETEIERLLSEPGVDILKSNKMLLEAAKKENGGNASLVSDLECTTKSTQGENISFISESIPSTKNVKSSKELKNQLKLKQIEKTSFNMCPSVFKQESNLIGNRKSFELTDSTHIEDSFEDMEKMNLEFLCPQLLSPIKSLKIIDTSKEKNLLIQNKNYEKNALLSTTQNQFKKVHIFPGKLHTHVINKNIGELENAESKEFLDDNKNSINRIPDNCSSSTESNIYENEGRKLQEGTSEITETMLLEEILVNDNSKLISSLPSLELQQEAEISKTLLDRTANQFLPLPFTDCRNKLEDIPNCPHSSIEDLNEELKLPLIPLDKLQNQNIVNNYQKCQGSRHCTQKKSNNISAPVVRRSRRISDQKNKSQNSKISDALNKAANKEFKTSDFSNSGKNPKSMLKQRIKSEENEVINLNKVSHVENTIQSNTAQFFVVAGSSHEVLLQKRSINDTNVHIQNFNSNYMQEDDKIEKNEKNIKLNSNCMQEDDKIEKNMKLCVGKRKQVSKLKAKVLRQVRAKSQIFTTNWKSRLLETSGNKSINMNNTHTTECCKGKIKKSKNTCCEDKTEQCKDNRIRIVQNILIPANSNNVVDLLNESECKKSNVVENCDIRLSEHIDQDNTYSTCKGVTQIMPDLNMKVNCDLLSQIMGEMDKDKPRIISKPKRHITFSVPNSNIDKQWRNGVLDIAENIYGFPSKSMKIPQPVNKNQLYSPKLKITVKKRILLTRLSELSSEENIPEEIILEFKRHDVYSIADLILQKVSQDIHDKPENKYYPAPLMTKTQRVLLELMVRLEQENIETVMDTFLSKAEGLLFKIGCGIKIVIPVTRLYMAVCKLRRDIGRIRYFCCQAFFSMNDLAVPLLFTVLTSWTEVLPMESDMKVYPIAKVLIQVVHLKKCNKAGYNLFPLKSLFNQFYGYPKERWNCDEVFHELFQQYLRNPDSSSDLAIRLLCKNKDSKWVFKKLNEFFKPLVYKIPLENVNFKATVIILIGNICKNFKPKLEFDKACLNDLRRWLIGLTEDGTVHELVVKSVDLSLSNLPKKMAVKKRKKKQVKLISKLKKSKGGKKTANVTLKLRKFCKQLNDK